MKVEEELAKTTLFKLSKAKQQLIDELKMYSRNMKARFDVRK